MIKNADTEAPAPIRARIYARTSKVILPVPPSGRSDFSIVGTWGSPDDDYGPDATAVTLLCRARIAKRNSEYRLTRDTIFGLPEGTEAIEIRVVLASPVTDLEVAVTFPREG